MAEETFEYNLIKKVPREKWDRLAEKKIYFGHQSVGFNIIDGIKQATKENAYILLNIQETTESAKFATAIFAHSRIGSNTDPQGKIEDFVNLINQSIGNTTDIAFFKFCYVDITSSTDVNLLFQKYKDGIKKINLKNPSLKIIHVTVPLTTSKTTWKTKIKKIMGKKLFEYEDNIKRNKFNELLQQEYKGVEPIFDLAKIEATSINDRTATFVVDGKKYYSLLPEYSNDGGHLNHKGKNVVSEQLLVFLATNPNITK